MVCASEDLYDTVREHLHGKNRDEIFELPLVYGIFLAQDCFGQEDVLYLDS